MSSTVQLAAGGDVARSSGGWGDLWRKEDWWAIWIGLGLLIAALVFFSAGSPGLKWIAVTPGKWTTFDQLGDFFGANWGRFVAQLALWLVLFGTAATALGFKARVLPFLSSASMSLVDRHHRARQLEPGGKYNLEPPLVALCWGC